MEPNPKENIENKKSLSGNKTFLIIISCWFVFYMFISLTGGGG